MTFSQNRVGVVRTQACVLGTHGACFGTKCACKCHISGTELYMKYEGARQSL